MSPLGPSDPQGVESAGAQRSDRLHGQGESCDGLVDAFTGSLRVAPGVNFGRVVAAMAMAWPVLGLRPERAHTEAFSKAMCALSAGATT